MTDLNPQVILSGMYTQHPVQVQNPLDAAATAAQVQQSQASTGLINQQAQAAGIQNQLNMQNLMAGRKTYMQFNSPPAGGAPATGGAGVAAAGGGVSAAPGSTPGVAPSASANTPPGTAPGTTTSALPPGAAYIDHDANWYLDKDGQPLPFTTGPRLRPDGTQNRSSLGYINDYTKALFDNGATPDFVEAQRKTLTDNALELDQKFPDFYAKTQEAKASQAKAAVDAANVRKIGRDEANDDAFKIANSSNPQATYQALFGQNPSLLAAAGLTGNFEKDIENINTMARLSPQGQAAMKNATEMAKNEAETAKARQDTSTSATTQTKTQQETGLTGAAKLTAAQQNVAEKSIALDKTDRALTLLHNYIGGHPNATLGEIQNFFGTNPEFAEARALLSVDNLTALKEGLGQGNRLSQTEYRTLQPTQVNPSMPGTAIQNLLTINRRLQVQDYDAARTDAKNTAVAIKPSGLDTSGVEKAANMPDRSVSPVGAAAVSGKTYTLPQVQAMANKYGITTTEAYDKIIKSGGNVH